MNFPVVLSNVTKITLFTLAVVRLVRLLTINANAPSNRIGMLVFEERRKTEYPEKNV